MHNQLYGIPIKEKRWSYHGYTIVEQRDHELIVIAPGGDLLPELTQEFAYNLTAYRLGALQLVYNKIDARLG